METNAARCLPSLRMANERPFLLSHLKSLVQLLGRVRGCRLRLVLLPAHGLVVRLVALEVVRTWVRVRVRVRVSVRVKTLTLTLLFGRATEADPFGVFAESKYPMLTLMPVAVSLYFQ